MVILTLVMHAHTADQYESILIVKNVELLFIGSSPSVQSSLRLDYHRIPRGMVLHVVVIRHFCATASVIWQDNR